MGANTKQHCNMCVVCVCEYDYRKINRKPQDEMGIRKCVPAQNICAHLIFSIIVALRRRCEGSKLQ